MILRLTAVLCLLLPFTLSAQKKMKFGKIPAEDLAMTVYEKDTSAAAVVLGEVGMLSFEFVGGEAKVRMNVHRRVKILNRSGFDKGDVSLRYYSYNNSSSISGVKVSVFNPDGSEKSLSKKDIFTDKISDYVSAKKFSAPGLTEGSIIDYKYSLTSENIFSLQRWFFQEDIPVRSSEYTVKVPDAYKYVQLSTGEQIRFDPPKVTNERVLLSNLGVRGSTGSTDLLFKTTRFYVSDMPAMKEENYVTTMEDYLTNIQFQLSSIEIPGQILQPVLTNWKEVADNMVGRKSFGSQYLKKNNYKKVSAEATEKMAKADTDTEKVQAAYDFVLDNIKWNDIYSMDVDESLNDVFTQKSGTSGELNLMLLALLKEADVTAVPVLISTRSNGKMIEVYPILNQFNHVLIKAEADGKTYFLDATNKNRTMGFPGVGSLNKRGWLVSDTPEWINIVTPSASDILMANVSLDEEGTLTGDLNVRCVGYSGFLERANAKGDEEGKYWQKRLAKSFSEVEVSNVVYDGISREEKKMSVKMNCTIPEAAQVNGDFIYFSPVIYSDFTENPFKLEERLYPVEIPYPFKDQIIINLTIPEGYVVEELPEQVNLSLPAKGGQFQYLISQKGNVLQIVNKLNLKQLTFSPEEYSGIKNFFDLIIEKQSAQIVLKKA